MLAQNLHSGAHVAPASWTGAPRPCKRLPAPVLFPPLLRLRLPDQETLMFYIWGPRDTAMVGCGVQQLGSNKVGVQCSACGCSRNPCVFSQPPGQAALKDGIASCRSDRSSCSKLTAPQCASLLPPSSSACPPQFPCGAFGPGEIALRVPAPTGMACTSTPVIQSPTSTGTAWVTAMCASSCNLFLPSLPALSHTGTAAPSKVEPLLSQGHSENH